MLRVYRLLPDSHYRVGAVPTEALHYVHDRTTLDRPIQTVKATCIEKYIPKYKNYSQRKYRFCLAPSHRGPTLGMKQQATKNIILEIQAKHCISNLCLYLIVDPRGQRNQLSKQVLLGWPV